MTVRSNSVKLVRTSTSEKVMKRKRAAAERHADRDMRSNAEQLDLLIIRGHAHCKEARRLEEAINGSV